MCGDVELNPGPPKVTRQAKLSPAGEIVKEDEIDNYKLAQMIDNMGEDIRGDIQGLRTSFEQHRDKTDKQVQDLTDEVETLRCENMDLKNFRPKDTRSKQAFKPHIFDVPETARGEWESSSIMEYKIRYRIGEANLERSKDILIGAVRRLGGKTEGKV